MTACADRVVSLHGLLDGELDAANTVEFETHLKSCDACHNEFLRLQALHDLIAAPEIRYRAPDRLRARLDQTFMTPLPLRPLKRRSMVTSWVMSGGLGAVAASLALLMAMPYFGHSRIEDQIVASHVRSLLANHLTDVETTNQHIVRPWFNGKIDFAPPVPELAAEGFPLAGGRLDYIDGRVVPAIVYHRRLHSINVFAWPADGTHLSGAQSSNSPMPEIGKTAHRDGYSLVEWTQGGLEFWAVSDIDPAELKAFQTIFSDNSPK